MSLDNIQLPAIVIQGLFKDSLIDLNIDQDTDLLGNTATFTFLGGNKRHIAVIVSDKEALYLSDNTLDLLLGILSACKLTMADIALINLAKPPAPDHMAITEAIGVDKLLLLGIGPDAIGLPLSFPVYQVQHYNDQTYLCAPDLATISTDKAEKAKLWAGLKQLFSLT